MTQKLGVELDRAGRVRVNPDLSLPAHPEVFAIGDLALVLDERGQPVPGISPAAMQMARHVARVIETELNNGKENLPARPAFKYWNKGTMATIGRSAAVAQIGRLEFSGWLAWVTWLLVHLIFLIGSHVSVLAFNQTVTPLKFLPFGRVVVEPFSQLVARCHILEPGGHGQRFLLMPRGQSRSTRNRSPSDLAAGS